MHIAIVGAGALGSVYGARLEHFGDCEVSIVSRAAGAPRATRLERVEDGEVLLWKSEPTDAVPKATDIVIACLPYEALSALPARVAATRAPVVVMTPMLPVDYARISSALPGRVRPGMPSVASYRNDAGATRYWLPHTATTHIQVDVPKGPEEELVRRLERAQIRALGQDDVLERNVATTVSFLPLALALDAAGSIDLLFGDPALLALAFEAADEGQRLGRTVGTTEAWAALLLRFVGPFTLKMFVAIARTRAREAVRLCAKLQTGDR